MERAEKYSINRVSIMWRRVFLLLIPLGIAGCATDPPLHLNWNVDGAGTYHFTKEPFPQDMDVDIQALLVSPSKLREKLAELRSLDLNPDLFPMHLKLNGEGGERINVLALNVSARYETEARDDVERLRREQREQATGLVRLNTVVDRYGQSRNPYQPRLQHALVALLLQMPDDPVTVGESWSLPVELLSLNTPFLAEQTHRINKVWVNDVVDKPGVGRVAQIVYLLQEDIRGRRQHFITEAPSPFRVSSSYLAVGEFHLESKKWLHYVGRLDSTIGFIRDISLIALVPVGEVGL